MLYSTSMKFLHNDPIMKERRQDLRTKSTHEEILLWNYLKHKKLGVKFRRQFGVGPYIADFFCYEFKLVIELDGEYHNTEDQKEYDTERNKFFEGMNYTVLRFSNDQVRDTVDLVLKRIQESTILQGAGSPPFRGSGR